MLYLNYKHKQRIKAMGIKLNLECNKEGEVEVNLGYNEASIGQIDINDIGECLRHTDFKVLPPNHFERSRELDYIEVAYRCHSLKMIGHFYPSKNLEQLTGINEKFLLFMDDFEMVIVAKNKAFEFYITD
jgi:hypothetical protein